MEINFSQSKKRLNPLNFIAILLGLTFISWQPIAFAENDVKSNVETIAETPTEQPSSAQAPIPPEQILHTDLVLLALKSDFFNHRCRGISVNKSFNKVNRLFITKYSLTANNYIKTFINADVKAEKHDQELEFKKELNKIGGCSAAVKQGWRKQINDLFNELYRQAEKSTWFPEE